jgi:glycosyltransferase involved in cell wall biosynthesis
MSAASTTAASRPYRFGFVLTTAAGNMTRTLNLRKYAERDSEVECVWADISHYLDPDPFRRLPYLIRTRCIVARQARPVMRQLAQMDAVMFHAFEPYLMAALRNRTASKPLLVWSQDNPPLSEARRALADYGGTKSKADWRRRWRFRFDVWCAQRVALFFPFSRWAGEVLIEDSHIAPEKVHPINVGLDLELWPRVPKTEPTPRAQILFVGGEFVRKGGDLLLDVYRRNFADSADLHLVTRQPPPDLPPRVFVHTDFRANDPRLRQLYAECDIFAMPTRADMSPWVILEAMATGRPVITTRTGGIPDMVMEGKTGFLIEPGDGAMLTERLRTLLADSELRQCLGAAGRDRVEKEFSAAVCVPRILDIMKRAVDASRGKI